MKIIFNFLLENIFTYFNNYCGGLQIMLCLRLKNNSNLIYFLLNVDYMPGTCLGSYKTVGDKNCYHADFTDEQTKQWDGGVTCITGEGVIWTL